MADMLHQGEDFISPVAQAEQNADANVIDAGLHSTVHRSYAPVKILFFAANMDGRIGLSMIGFLKKLIGADFSGLEFLEFVQSQWGDVHVDAADFAGTDFDFINGFDGFQDIRESFVGVRLACNQQNPFMTLPDKGFDFTADFILI